MAAYPAIAGVFAYLPPITHSPAMKKNLCIFDLDGTLLDSADDIADALHQALLDHNLPTHTQEAYRTFIGNGMLKLVQRGAPENMPQGQLEDLLTTTKRNYSTGWAVKTCPYPGVYEALKTLCLNNTLLMVLSNKPHEFTVEMTRHFFPDIPFADIRGQQDGVPIKPAPDTALAMIAPHTPDRAFFIGDLPVDILTGKAAQMTTIGVTWGFNPQTLAQSQPHITVHTPVDMVRAILQE